MKKAAYTLNQFKKDAAHLDPKLIAAVVRQIGGWNAMKECAQDISNYGAACGFAGFIYYSETEDFGRRHKEIIFDLLTQQADDCGEDVLKMIAGFNCLKSNAFTPAEVARAIYDRARTDDERHAKTQVMNAFSWFALEEVARALTDIQYDQKHSD